MNSLPVPTVLLVVVGLLALTSFFFSFMLMRRVSEIREILHQITTHGNEIETLPAGVPVPNFEGVDLAGHPVSLADFQKTPLAMVVFDGQCQMCNERVPGISRKEGAVAHGGYRLVAISIDSLDGTRAFVERHRLTNQVIVMPAETNSFMKDYRLAGTPSFYLVDESHVLIRQAPMGAEWFGMVDQWERGLAALEEGKPQYEPGSGSVIRSV